MRINPIHTPDATAITPYLALTRDENGAWCLELMWLQWGIEFNFGMAD